MADEALFQFLHNEVIQYIYKSDENEEMVSYMHVVLISLYRNTWEFWVYKMCISIVVFMCDIFDNPVILGKWKVHYQTGEHGLQGGPRTDRKVGFIFFLTGRWYWSYFKLLLCADNDVYDVVNINKHPLSPNVPCSWLCLWIILMKGNEKMSVKTVDLFKN